MLNQYISINLDEIKSHVITLAPVISKIYEIWNIEIIRRIQTHKQIKNVKHHNTIIESNKNNIQNEII